ncbi:L-fucose mutarotase [Candidatus Sumerlaeota bacterium]|nr:L-fucose mutarotase [Candidatus Sumerlaeota bacterium]
MLKGISPVLSPDLLYILARMGHGDEIVLTDAHYPAESNAKRLLRADGVRIVPLLEGILQIFPIDPPLYCKDPLVMMAPVPGDSLDPETEPSYRAVIDKYCPERPPITRIERFDFYERSRQAFAIVITGETAKYSNIILKKGVVLPE